MAPNSAAVPHLTRVFDYCIAAEIEAPPEGTGYVRAETAEDTGLQLSTRLRAASLAIGRGRNFANMASQPIRVESLHSGRRFAYPTLPAGCMIAHRDFLADTDGTTIDWMVLVAGITLLGAVTVYEVFVGGTNELLLNMNQNLGAQQGGISAVRAASDGSSAGSDDCDKPSVSEPAQDCDQRIAPERPAN